MKEVLFLSFFATFCISGFSEYSSNVPALLIEQLDLDAGKGPVYGQSWSPDGAMIASGAGRYDVPHTGATIVWKIP